MQPSQHLHTEQLDCSSVQLHTVELRHSLLLPYGQLPGLIC